MLVHQRVTVSSGSSDLHLREMRLRGMGANDGRITLMLHGYAMLCGYTSCLNLFDGFDPSHDTSEPKTNNAATDTQLPQRFSQRQNSRHSCPFGMRFFLRTLLWLAVEPTPLKNDGVSNSWDDSFFPIWWKNKKCSKPPTSADWDNDISWYIVWATHIFHVPWFILTVQEEQTWMPIWSQPSNLKIGVKFLVQQTVHENDVHSPVFWWLTAHSNCVLNPISSVLWQWNPSSP